MIPKVTPKIPDIPGTFTIGWEDSLQKAGLILTEKLRLLERKSEKIRSRVFPNLNQPQIPNQPGPMEYNRRHLGTNSQGNTTGPEKKEIQTAHNINTQQSNQSGQKT